MLFSSGDSPRNLSSILSGEGLDEVERGESPFVPSAVTQDLFTYLWLSSPEATRRLKSAERFLGTLSDCQ
jgi:hypothetical protein